MFWQRQFFERIRNIYFWQDLLKAFKSTEGNPLLLIWATPFNLLLQLLIFYPDFEVNFQTTLSMNNKEGIWFPQNQMSGLLNCFKLAALWNIVFNSMSIKWERERVLQIFHGGH